MASVVKCMAAMTGIGLLGGAGTNYYLQSKVNKKAMEHAKGIARNGMIPIGGMKPDGTLWDGKISLDEFQKENQKRAAISSLVTGGIAAVGTMVISGLTLLLRGKIK